MRSRWHRRLVAAALLSLPLASAPAAPRTSPPPAPAQTDSSGAARDSLLDREMRDVAASLRCPVCQNLSILDSPSQLARDMKRVVRDRLAAGQTPDEVRRYFVSRYGEWVLLKPRAAGVSLSVWLLPLVALAGGIAVVWSAVRRWVRQGAAGARGLESGAPGALALDTESLRARRGALRASLKELETEFAAGRLAPADLAALRQRDEAELAGVTEALKRLPKAELEGAGAPQRPVLSRQPGPARHVPPALAWGAGVGAFALVVALSLKGAIVARAPGGTITGVQAGAAAEAAVEESGPLDSLRVTQLEARVRRDSSDQAALIELGHLYLTQRRLKEASQVTARAILLAPDAEGTAEAFAHMGMILWSAGETQAALKSLDKALFLHPDYPEALLYKGIILFAGVHDMRAAEEPLQRYLDVAPPDANTARVRTMLEAARSQAP